MEQGLQLIQVCAGQGAWLDEMVHAHKSTEECMATPSCSIALSSGMNHLAPTWQAEAGKDTKAATWQHKDPDCDLMK